MKNLSHLTSRIEAIKLEKELRQKSPLALAAFNLKTSRQLKKLTVREAAELCSMAVGTYTSLEKGNPGSGVENLLKALDIMEVDLRKAFVELDLPHGGVITKIKEGKAHRRFPETNSVKLRAMGMSS